MKVNFITKNAVAHFDPLVFPGFWRGGSCSVASHYRSGNFVFLCQQKYEHHGNSIFNCVEEVRQQVFKRLQQDGLLKIDIKLSLRERFFLSPATRDENVYYALIKHMNKHSVWINHSIRDGVDSFCFVQFDDLGSPIFNYVNLDELQREYPEICFRGDEGSSASVKDPLVSQRLIDAAAKDFEMWASKHRRFLAQGRSHGLEIAVSEKMRDLMIGAAKSETVDLWRKNLRIL